MTNPCPYTKRILCYKTPTCMSKNWSYMCCVHMSNSSNTHLIVKYSLVLLLLIEIWACSVQVPMIEIQYSTCITCLALNLFTREVPYELKSAWSNVVLSEAAAWTRTPLEIPDELVPLVLLLVRWRIPCCIPYCSNWDWAGKGIRWWDKQSEKTKCDFMVRKRRHLILGTVREVGRELV